MTVPYIDSIMIIKRHKTRVATIGNVKIGGNNLIAVQSMVKVPAKDIRATIEQIKKLESVGCQIARLAILDEQDAHAISQIRALSGIPLVADIHFDWKLAICAIKAGVDKIRLNPGNIHKKDEIREIVALAKEHKIPIRVGLNSGSLPKQLRHKGKLTPAQRMVKAAQDYIEILEGLKFKDIVVSLKCSNILDTIEAYQKMAQACDYPLHLGLTATGFIENGKIKSAICLGSLLAQGIGDTIRVSLTGPPEEEVAVARSILANLGLGESGPEIISCPTCGRTQVDLEKIVNELQAKLSGLGNSAFAKPVKIAVMGCVVNGPGEAEGADLAIICGKAEGLLYRKAKVVKKVPIEKAVEALMQELKQM